MSKHSPIAIAYSRDGFFILPGITASNLSDYDADIRKKSLAFGGKLALTIN